MTDYIVSGSFRDPNGFLFVRDDTLYRQINSGYQHNYETLMESGLYEELAGSGLMVSHEDVSLSLKKTDDAYKIIKPELIRFISYPYEWCFSQLKDAALLTLQIQKMSLKHGMSLKDASAYNIKFDKCRPLFIDTLSFELYREGEPWVAYRQFCQHFLAPLALMQYIDPHINQWLKNYIDGIPLDLTAKLLPFSTRLRYNLLTNIHWHARSQKKYEGRAIEREGRKFSKFAMLGFIDSLENAVTSLKWLPKNTVWGEYYDDTNYTSDAFDDKKKIISKFIHALCPKNLWDIGANNGVFSRIASNTGIHTVSFDFDPACVEQNYLEARKNNEANILPLCLDATNPSPDLGWNNKEMMSLKARGPCDTLMALALIHHFAIASNVPLIKIASFFSEVSQSLIIEWIPKEDSQVQRLLASREDIFDTYTQESFEASFKKYFNIIESANIRDSSRILYLMKKKHS